MTNKKTRIISVLITVLLLISSLPFSASAAISLALTSEFVKLEPPTVTPTEFYYGLTYGELTFTGGAVYYDGVLVPGTFTCRKGYDTRVISVSSSGDFVYLPFRFTPDDTTTYSSANYTYREEYGIENWPTITVNPIEVEKQGSFPEISVALGTDLSNVTIPEGTKIVNAETKEEITTGVWEWRDEESHRAGLALESGEYTIRWTGTGYATQYDKIKVNVTESDYTGLAVLPTGTAPEEYADNMTYADIALEGGIAYCNGQIAAGHYEIAAPTTAIATSQLGKSASIAVKFVPDDESLAEAFASLTSNITVKMPNGRTIPIRFTGDEIAFEHGVAYSAYAKYVVAGLEYTTEAGKSLSIDMKWAPLDLRTYNVGDVVKDVEITVSVPSDATYQSFTVTKDIRLVERVLDEAFGTLTAKEDLDLTAPEGQYLIGLSFNDKDKSGTVTVKVNGEIIEEGIAPTYKSGESQKYKYIAFVAPESGTYTVTAEYFPGDSDKYVYKDPTLTATFDAVVREVRNITVVGGTRSDTLYYAGDRMTVEIDGTTVKEENFDRWVITDANGNVVPVSALSSDTYTVTEESLTHKKLIIIVPEYDITITAKKKGAIEIPTVPGTDDGSFDFASIWASIVEFFTGLKDISVFSWLARLLELIWAFITGFINGLAE